jgi:hypothetical protein
LNVFCGLKFVGDGESESKIFRPCLIFAKITPKIFALQMKNILLVLGIVFECLLFLLPTAGLIPQFKTASGIYLI